jgi:hypothetical protein
VTDSNATRMKTSFPIALMAALLSSLPAAAQTSEEAPTGARLRLGPLQLRPSVLLQDVGIDSNVFNSLTTTARPQKEWDFTFALTPAVDGTAGSQRARLLFHAATDFVYFARHESERGANQDVNATGVYSLGRLTLSGGGSYWNTRRRPNEEIDERARRTEMSGSFNARVALFGRIGAVAGTRMARTRYDSQATFDNTLLAETLNRQIRVHYGGVRYALTPLTTLTATAELGHERFPRSPLRDSDSVAAYGGVEFNPRAILSGAARVGYQRFRPAGSVLPPFVGVVGSVDIAYRVYESTVVGVTVDRRPAYSYEQLAPYYIWEGAGVSLVRGLTSTFKLDVRARRLWYRYRELGGASQAMSGSGRTDTWSETAVALHHDAGARIASSFRVSYWARQSNARDYSHLDGLRMGTTLLFRF